MRVLYVEDEKFLAEAVIHLLKKNKILVDWASDGEQGLELARKPYYDAIILDIMLPKINGLDILKTIRTESINTPVIILSALSGVEDKITGLEKGADDYLAKPFKTAELIARLNAITRRPPIATSREKKYADLTLNPDNRTLNDIPITDKEYMILEMLFKQPESVIHKTQILSYVWGPENIYEENYVEVYMSYIRKKLKTLKSCVEIKTVRNLGYKLVKNV